MKKKYSTIWGRVVLKFVRKVIRVFHSVKVIPSRMSYMLRKEMSEFIRSSVYFRYNTGKNKSEFMNVRKSIESSKS